MTIETGWIVAMVLGAIFAGYVLTSVLLLRFPTLIHRKKQIKFRAAHISHRGGKSIRITLKSLSHTCKTASSWLAMAIDVNCL